ncbi:hypothetical protein GCM10027341_31930 [Spirosoma knui]
MHSLLRICLVLFVQFSLLTATYAQSDSVVVTGRIRNLSARLYRESPTVLISRNNILQATRELVRPAPLNVDGTFRVALPLIYAQEEMYFNYGRISTAFLAAPGTLRIDLNADSLFTAAVPFQFSGVNAQVNQQFARYKAFEASFKDKPDGKKLTSLVEGRNNVDAYRLLLTAYQKPFRAFAGIEKPFPLVTRWIGSTNQYGAAAFLYEKALYEDQKLPTSLDDSLRPPNDQLLTAARASAMNQFANYAMQYKANAQTSEGVAINKLAALLLRYGRNLSSTERSRLEGFVETNSAKSADIRFFEGLVKRSNDTIQRLVSYENAIRRSRSNFGESATNYITAYLLASTLPALTLNFAKLLYDYARPRVTEPALAQSLDEMYRLEVKDSTRIRGAVQTFQRANGNASALEISPGAFFTRSDARSGSDLLDQVINANRGKVIYILMTYPAQEGGRQAAIDAQRLRSAYSPRDFALVYLPLPDTDKMFWPELAARYNLSGDHLLLSTAQLEEAYQRLRPDSEISATVINRVGKIVKRNAPLPSAFDDAKKLIDKNL